ncbi:MAG: PorT family protein [Bacteroidetes bacterium]|nr:PorT family protein [Bacteroidota bacterium]
MIIPSFLNFKRSLVHCSISVTKLTNYPAAGITTRFLSAEIRTFSQTKPVKKSVLLILLATPSMGYSQINIGAKAGLNFVNVTSAAGINAGNRTSYMIGGYISPKPKKLIGFRSEIILSRQGYDYKTGTATGNVNLDYLLIPQLITLNFTKKFQINAGGQAAFLMNAAVDSSGGSGGNSSLFDYFNRFTYGLVAGAEVSPIGGFFIGSCLNVSLKNLNRDNNGGSSPGFIPKELIKNNVVQIYTGWRF